jgi:hypothetical protein
MSEQEKPKSFMGELDLWITKTVIEPMMYGDPDDDPNSRSWEDVVDQVRHAIREKVLESYHNGQRVGPAKSVRPTKAWRR